ncbi:ribonuclease H-like domain-containing protein [Mycena vitilis]|nr:ribonuclease H-like domain-containing protein [Mycena vitilis]
MSNSIDVSVYTNSFPITRLPTKDYFQYDVSFVPEVDIPHKRERAMHLLQNSVAPIVFQPRGVYDGNRLLWLSHTLNLPGGGGAASFTIRLGNDPNAPVGSPGVVQVMITKTASDIIRPTDLNRLITASTHQTVDRKAATAINLLQLLIRQSSNQNNPTNNGRAFFSPMGKRVLQGTGIELWRGYFQSVRPTIGRMIVTIDTSMAAVYESGALIEVAMSVLNVRSTRDLTLANPGDPNLRKLQTHFKNRLITTRTTGDKTKTIHEIVPGPIGRYTFQKDGRNTTIQDHFRAAYNVTLAHPGTFGVRISGRSAPFPVIVPAELCIVKPGQLYKKRLPSSATAAAVDFATMAPQARMQAIAGSTPGAHSLQSPIHGYGNSEYVRDAGMVVGQQPLMLKAKLLAHPRMEFAGSELSPENGAWNVLKRRFKKPTSLASWAVVNYDGQRISDELAQKVIVDLMGACRALAMGVEEPRSRQRGDPHAPEKILNSIHREMRGKVDLILVLLPKSAEEVRNRIKFWGDVAFGVRTSCLREDKLQRANNQYFNNVAIKLNGRLGGAYALPKTIVIAGLRPFICFGADVSHPSPGSSRPSIASLVYSWDPKAASYVALSEVQPPRLEIIQGLQRMVKKAIIAFSAQTPPPPPPQQIFFYRDGVSEGEIQTVKDHEITAVRQAFREVWTERGMRAPLPTITFIVVVKRHHAIFVPNDNRIADGKTGNCRAGLIVDDLRSPLAQDFYLQSHGAIKGTSRSGHYSVLLDENFGDDVLKIQQLSFELCHVYAKATRSISLPAPVYYADMVCARAKFHVPNNDFESSTNVSGPEEFDLEYWQGAYQPVYSANNYDKCMYFL